jgi:hypothetical protein
VEGISAAIDEEVVEVRIRVGSEFRVKKSVLGAISLLSS